jgi:hypothetical protein
MSRTKSPICASASVGGVIETSMPVAQHVQVAVGHERRDLDQRVVSRSRPVISQSIHTNASFTVPL